MLSYLWFIYRNVRFLNVLTWCLFVDDTLRYGSAHMPQPAVSKLDSVIVY